LCTAQIEEEITAGIESCITLTTVDYHGNVRKTGGDPIQAEIQPVRVNNNQSEKFKIMVV